MKPGVEGSSPGAIMAPEHVDLALSVNEAVLWSFGFADHELRWMPGMDELLGLPEADDDQIRDHLRELVEPLTVAARTSPVWEDLHLERSHRLPSGNVRVLSFRARRFGDAKTGGLAGSATDVSRARDDRQALTDLADRYRLLIELSPDAICVHQDGYLQYANPAGIAMIAAESESQIVGHSINEFVDERSLPALWERIGSLEEAGSATKPTDAILRRLDGRRVLVEAVSVRTSWEGKPAFQVIMRDVTERKAAQATMRYQAALVEHVSDAIIATASDGTVTSWNPAAEAVYGIPEEEAVGRVVHDLVSAPLDPQALVALGGVTEAVHRHANGSALFVRVSAAQMDEGYVLVCADETARRRAERESATVVATLDEGVIAVGANGVIESANPAAHRILDVGESELVGTASASWPMFDEAGEFIPEDSHPTVRTRRTGVEEFDRVIRMFRSDGESVWLAVTCRTLSAEDRPPYPVVASFTDITRQRQHTEMLRYQVTHDELTGLLNRKGFNELLSSLVASGSEHVAVLFCDIDNFKRVNDSLGHEAGDELLVAIARRLTAGLPEACTAARLSGDEFLIVCADVEAVGGLEALTLWVSEYMRTVVPVRNQLISVSASTGAAMLERSMSGEDLLRYADVAMFHAKRRRSGRVSLADPALMTAAKWQLRLEEELREAIRRDELSLHYQPVFDRDRAVVAAEALVRWNHPERGLLSPGVILPVAEQGGLLADLDRWVLRTAMRESQPWRNASGTEIVIGINLGSLLPDDPNFVDEVVQITAEVGMEPTRVVLEMVETALVDLSASSQQSMVELVRRGFSFAVDDFGTGYSSLARLKDIPAQVLKLDRRFVSDVEFDKADRAIARAMVDLARAMGHVCVAEGVETEGQFRILEDLGVDYFQGFLLHRPVPVESFEQLL